MPNDSMLAAQAALQSGTNSLATATTNRATRKWNEKMYAKQREDSLADWTRQNEYNSPQAQMKRLQEGGLNPNLVYGNGADATAGPVRSTDVKSWNPSAPQINIPAMTQAFMGQYDMEMKMAQTDNLRTQNTVLLQEVLLKAAQVIATTTGTENQKFDLALKNELKENSIEVARASLDKIKADTQSTLDENERRAAMQAPNLLTAAENVLNMRSQRASNAAQREEIAARIVNLKKDTRLKELDIALKEQGIQPSDAAWLRMLTQLVNGNSNLLEKVNERLPGKAIPQDKRFPGQDPLRDILDLFR